MEIDLEGTWFNQHGSRLDLVVHPDGRLDGAFRSGVGFSGLDEPYVVNGRLRDHLVTFHVDFGEHGTITAWTGHSGLDHGEPTIHTLWHMAVREAGGQAHALWRGTWSGADTFTREEARSATRRRPSYPVFDPPA